MDKLFANSLKIAVSSSSVKIIGLLLTPIITRLYSPEQYGDFGLLMTIVALFQPLTGGKLENAIIVSKNQAEGYTLYNASIYLSLLFVGFSLLLGVLLKGFGIIFPVSDFNLFVLAPLLLFFMALFNSNKLMLNNLEKYNKMAVLNVSSGISTSLLRLCFGLVDSLKNFGLVLSEIWHKALYVIMSQRAIMRSCPSSVSFFSPNLNQTWNVVKAYKRFPLYEVPLGLVVSLTSRFTVFLLIGLYSKTILGYFIFSEQMLRKFVDLFSTSIGEVFYKKASISGQEEMSRFTIDLFTKLLVIGYLFFSPVLFWGKELFSFAFGDEWGKAGIFSQILSPFLFAVFVFKPIQSIYRLVGRQDVQLFSGFVQMILSIISIYIGWYFFESDEYSIVFFSITNSSIIYFNIYYVLRKSKNDLKKLLMSRGKIVLFLFTASLPYIIGIFYVTNSIPMIIAQECISVGILGLLFFHYDKENFKQLVKF
ncbi:lipopolysaccharide biosynthesis protein [Reichenbachiella versicolor]|uniref:lipopolysaccharide biosynthesis protein n=1 Tax=Reichenbachiella versicolor TaxID=1821036 RepID=UPI0013A54C71|nr:lipopolysaccharide biosynthesis protein [Reichenbachiella versicolor]